MYQQHLNHYAVGHPAHNQGSPRASNCDGRLVQTVCLSVLSVGAIALLAAVGASVCLVWHRAWGRLVGDGGRRLGGREVAVVVLARPHPPGVCECASGRPSLA